MPTIEEELEIQWKFCLEIFATKMKTKTLSADEIKKFLNDEPSTNVVEKIFQDKMKDIFQKIIVEKRMNDYNKIYKSYVDSSDVELLNNEQSAEDKIKTVNANEDIILKIKIEEEEKKLELNKFMEEFTKSSKLINSNNLKDAIEKLEKAIKALNDNGFKETIEDFIEKLKK